MRVLVLTVVHTPLDARIHAREATALLDAGHTVTLAAPFGGHGVDPVTVDPRLEVVDVPRAHGRRRLRALRATRRLLRTTDHDVVVLHDPELLLALVGLRPRAAVVWDVHEDLAASLGDKSWLPRVLVRPLRVVIRLVERWAERRCTLLLAETGYAARLRGTHPVVPNLPLLPDHWRGPVEDRVVYLGRVSRLRGAAELIFVGRGLAALGITLEVIGPVDGDVRGDIEAAAARGDLRLTGFLPNDAALVRLDGALAGLSLLHDHPNYLHSLPTKVVEYQAAGVPVITTPLPAAVDIVESARSGVVVPFRDAEATVAAVATLREDRERAWAFARAGRADAEAGRSWPAVAAFFVAQIERAATTGDARRHSRP